ncbi:2-hydroxyacylsphingosine 1-beta-galactosyltransferase-like [Diaphorina citri]|nr:2-hydroxyacylsphingosine 1-beta-galactosyltransferase-like [Diaphorina citri]
MPTGHRNCKLFITHGGIHSSMEAVYHGVPVVMMPGFSDQHQNCKLMEEKGMGLITPHETITGDILYITIREVLNNPR